MRIFVLSAILGAALLFLPGTAFAEEKAGAMDDIPAGKTVVEEDDDSDDSGDDIPSSPDLTHTRQVTKSDRQHSDGDDDPVESGIEIKEMHIKVNVGSQSTSEDEDPEGTDVHIGHVDHGKGEAEVAADDAAEETAKEAAEEAAAEAAREAASEAAGAGGGAAGP